MGGMGWGIDFELFNSKAILCIAGLPVLKTECDSIVERL